MDGTPHCSVNINQVILFLKTVFAVKAGLHLKFSKTSPLNHKLDWSPMTFTGPQTRASHQQRDFSAVMACVVYLVSSLYTVTVSPLIKPWATEKTFYLSGLGLAFLHRKQINTVSWCAHIFNWLGLAPATLNIRLKSN